MSAAVERNGTKPIAKPSDGFQRALAAIAQKLRECEGQENVRKLEFTIYFDKGHIGKVQSHGPTTDH